MKKAAVVFSAAALMTMTAFSAPTPAEARGGWGWGAGIRRRLLAGALIGGLCVKRLRIWSGLWLLRTRLWLLRWLCARLLRRLCPRILWGMGMADHTTDTDGLIIVDIARLTIVRIRSAFLRGWGRLVGTNLPKPRSKSAPLPGATPRQPRHEVQASWRVFNW